MPLIPIRLNLDLVQVGVAGEAAQALGGECIPGSAEGVDDGVCGVEQAGAPVLLAQVQPDPLHRVEVCALTRCTDLPGGNPGRLTLAPAGSTRGGSGGDEW